MTRTVVGDLYEFSILISFNGENMNKFIGALLLLLLAGCCSTGTHRTAKKANETVKPVTDMQGKTTYSTKMFNFNCEKDQFRFKTCLTVNS